LEKIAYNEQWLETYYQDSCWYKSLKSYNKQWLLSQFEDSCGYWNKREYDNQWLEIYFEDSKWSWNKLEDWKRIRFRKWKYTVDGIEAQLKPL